MTAKLKYLLSCLLSGNLKRHLITSYTVIFEKNTRQISLKRLLKPFIVLYFIIIALRCN